MPRSSKSNSSSKQIHDMDEQNLNWEWYEPPVESIPVEFCLEASLHGLKYLGQRQRHVCERLFWLIAFIISCLAAGYLIFTMWKDYTNMPIVTVLNPNEKTLEEIPFPSVTICNVNNIQKSAYKNIVASAESIMANHGTNAIVEKEDRDTLAMFVDMNYICDSNVAFLDRFVENTSLDEYSRESQKLMEYMDSKVKYVSPMSTLGKVSQPCDEMILHCTWEDEKRKCSELFQTIATDYGICCTFNSVPLSKMLKDSDRGRNDNVGDWTAEGLDYETLIFTEETKERKYPYRQRSAGKSSGLSFLVSPDLEEYYCPNTDSEGFVMGINVPLDFPRMKDHGTAVTTGSEVFVGVEPEITMSDKLLKRFDHKRRKCYYGNEFILPHYTMYTISNCKSECIARNVLNVCGCLHYYMPRDRNVTLCHPRDYQCVDGVQKNISKRGLSTVCKECLPTCNEIDYHKQVSRLRLQRSRVKEFFRGQNKTLKAHDVSIVHVYFRTDSVYPKLRKQMMTLIQLISNAGGLLGLCLGFSVLSLLEICYYGTMRVCCSWHRTKALMRPDENNKRTDSCTRTATWSSDSNWSDENVFQVSSRRHLDLRFYNTIEEQIQRAFINSHQNSRCGCNM